MGSVGTMLPTLAMTVVGAVAAKVVFDMLGKAEGPLYIEDQQTRSLAIAGAGAAVAVLGPSKFAAVGIGMAAAPLGMIVAQMLDKGTTVGPAAAGAGGSLTGSRRMSPAAMRRQILQSRGMVTRMNGANMPTLNSCGVGSATLMGVDHSYGTIVG